MRASGRCELIIILHRVCVQTTGLGTRATHVRVSIGVARFAIPLVVIWLIQIIISEDLIVVSIYVLAHGTVVDAVVGVICSAVAVVISEIVAHAVLVSVQYRSAFVLVLLRFVIKMAVPLGERRQLRRICLRR